MNGNAKYHRLFRIVFRSWPVFVELIGLCLCTVPITLIGQEPGPIAEGRVIEATTSAPIPNAHITCGSASATSSANGTFRLAMSQSDSCRIQIVAPGFYTQENDLPFVNARDPQALKLNLLAMFRHASISGFARLSNKQAVSESRVYLLKSGIGKGPRRLNMLDSTNTGRDGAFRFTGLRAGIYYILCSPSPSPSPSLPNTVQTSKLGQTGTKLLAPTFYPAALTAEAALPIKVGPGDHLMELSLEVQDSLAHQITGRVLFSDRAIDISKAITLDLQRRVRAGSGGVVVDPVRAPLPAPYGRILLNSNGSFQIDGVLPGSYDLICKWRGSYGKSLAAEIEMPNKDLFDLKVEYQPPIRIEGRVVLAEEKKLGEAETAEPPILPKSVWIGSDDNIALSSFLAPIDAKGTFTLPLIPEGNYQVYLFGGMPDASKFYVESIVWNDREMPALSFGVNGVGNGRLTVNLRSGRGGLKGVASPRAAKAVMFPLPLRDIDLLRGAVQVADVDAQGTFRHLGVPPGNYRVCLVESLADMNFQEWTSDPGNLATIDSHCEKFQLKGKETVSVFLSRLLPVNGR